jgi:hypothetical protein
MRSGIGEATACYALRVHGQTGTDPLGDIMGEKRKTHAQERTKKFGKTHSVMRVFPMFANARIRASSMRLSYFTQ